MSEIDLIPQEYRTRRWQMTWVKRSAAALVLLLGGLGAAAAALAVMTSNANSRVEALQTRQAMTAQQRADLEMRNGTGQTPLMSAAHRGRSEVIDLLLLNSADPNAESDHGFLPLHRAAAAGHEDAVRVLLKGRANPLAIDGRRKSPMLKRDSAC